MEGNGSSVIHKSCGLSGRWLGLAQTACVVLPAFILFGYNQSGLGGLISLKAWVKVFPEIDTINTEGAEKSHKSTIQGLVVCTSFLFLFLMGSGGNKFESHSGY